MLINKDTAVYGSFSSNPGNNGCKFFNTKFQENNINAIYKSFYGNDPKSITSAVRTLGFSGFAVSMPLKVSILPYLDEIDINAEKIGAVNTVLNRKNRLVGYNTDWLGIKKYFESNNIRSVSIIGDGGFSKAIQYYCDSYGVRYEVFNRDTTNRLNEAKYKVFNATPADFSCDIDGRPNTSSGKQIASFQAEEQYKLYKSE